jgi:hypothetical protein
MRAGKWILALTEPGSDLAKLISDYSKGLAVPARDMPGIQHALQSWQQSASNQFDSIQAEPILDSYSSGNSGERLCHIFDTISAES